MVGDRAGFEAVGAAESPVADGDALDEGLLDDAVGFEFVDEVGEEGVEFGADFVGVGSGHDDGLGEQAMLEGVAGDFGFALGCGGTGGFLRVLLIGEALLGGSFPIKNARGDRRFWGKERSGVGGGEKGGFGGAAKCVAVRTSDSSAQPGGRGDIWLTTD